MGIDSVAEFIDAVRQHHLLELEQLEDVVRRRATFATGRGLAKHLIEKGWLTPYQINQLFQKSGQDLVLGQYVILERLGEGGMGQVFKAKHRLLDRIVALKIIRREHVANVDAVRRFRREIQASAQLSHANIVMAYDADQVGETHFMVMEFVDGTELSSLVKQHGPPPMDRATDYIRQAAVGLQHAHERGMVHRDIKPSNLLVTRPTAPGVDWGPTIKVLDMGVARLLQTPDALDSISALTKEGRVVGTPDFMSPEQAANSAKADIRSDLYSLGCTYYYLLTGQVPYPGGTPMEKLLKHRIDPLPVPERLRPEIPRGVAAIVRKLMAKKPDERFQAPADLVQALDRLSAPTETIQPAAASGASPFAHLVEGSGERPVARAIPMTSVPRMKRWAIIAAGIGILLLGLAFLGMALLLSGPKKTSEAPTPEDAATAQLRALADRAANPAMDRDAMRRDLLHFQWQYAGTTEALEAARLLMKLPSPLDALKHENLPEKERQALPPEVVAVLGEGQQRHWGAVRCVAASTEVKLAASGGENGTIRLWELPAMTERRSLPGHTGYVYWLGFTPDGQMLLSAGNDGYLRFWSNLAGNPTELPKLRASLGKATGAIALAPDGLTLALAIHAAAGEAAGVRLVDLKGIKDLRPPQLRPARLPTPGKPIQALAFSADGKLLAATSAGPQVLLWELSSAEPKEQAALTKPAGASLAAAFSREGQVLAVGVERSIVRWDLAKGPPADLPPLEGHLGEVRSLAFGPNGWLASGGAEHTLRLWDGTAAARKEMYTCKRGHANAVNGVAFVGTSPNLISGSQDTTVRQWALSRTEGHEVPAPLKEPAGQVSAIAVSPGGKFIAVAHDADPMVRLWEPTNDKPALLRYSVYTQALTFGSDGPTLAAGGLLGDRPRAWRVNDSGAWPYDDLPSVGARVTSMAFSPDGRLLAVGCLDDTVRVYNLAARSNTWRVLGKHTDSVQAVAFSPDGKTLASASEASRNDPRPVRLWNVETGAEVASLTSTSVAAVAFAPDGKSLATAGWDAASNPDLRVWDLRSNGTRFRSLNGGKGSHTAPLNGVAYTPDGEALVTSCRDGLVELQGPGSGHVTKSWRLGGAIRGIVLTADGRYVATANGNGTVYLLRLPQ